MGTIASVSIPETVLRGGGAFSHPFSF
jgi:hypothetical protein